MKSTIETIPYENVTKCLLENDYCVLQIDEKLQLDSILDIFRTTKNSLGLQPKDARTDYRGISLQFQPGAISRYSGLDRFSDDPSSASKARTYPFFLHDNDLGKQLNPFLGRLANLGLSRGRFLEMDAGAQLETHVDNLPRIHIALETNPEAVLLFDQSSFHIPSDGHAYLVNTTRRHSYKNGSNQSRAHLVFDVVGPHQAQVLKFLESRFSIESCIELYRSMLDVRSADKNTCQACGATPAPASLFIEFDSQNLDPSMANLFSVCRSCETKFLDWNEGQTQSPHSKLAVDWLLGLDRPSIGPRLQQILKKLKDSFD